MEHTHELNFKIEKTDDKTKYIKLLNDQLTRIETMSNKTYGDPKGLSEMTIAMIMVIKELKELKH